MRLILPLAIVAALIIFGAAPQAQHIIKALDSQPSALQVRPPAQTGPLTLQPIHGYNRTMTTYQVQGGPPTAGQALQPAWPVDRTLQ